MNNAFVDTTVICDVLLPCDSAKKIAAFRALAGYSQTEAPYYALKELRVGPLNSWILAHNVLVTHRTILDACYRLQTMTSHTPRRLAVGAAAIISGLLQTIRLIHATPTKPIDPKGTLENFLLREVSKAWRKRRTVVQRFVQPLSCYVDSDLELADGLIRVKGNRTECVKGAPCGAALELRKRDKDVRAVLRVLRQPKKAEGQKQETSSRRKALKEVLDVPAKDFPRRHCRALGDAYFCIAAPHDSEILTTNISDFQPMATVLNKSVKSP